MHVTEVDVRTFLGAMMSRRWSASLDGSQALIVRSLVNEGLAKKWVEGVFAARKHWNSDFDGEQFSLGRAWYTHVEQDLDESYFAHAAASDRIVEQFVPGLQTTMMASMQAAVGDMYTVIKRERWCGAGVHIFPHGEKVSREGGVVHFDAEGLDDSHLQEESLALSCILMLQPPQKGGGLRIWDKKVPQSTRHNDLADGQSVNKKDVRSVLHEHEFADDNDASMVIEYGIGDLVVIDSFRLHQIQPFEGHLDRISATLHGVSDDNLMLSWF